MSTPEARARLADLAWNANETINRMVEVRDADFADIHEAIQRVREHLEARARQTAP